MKCPFCSSDNNRQLNKEPIGWVNKRRLECTDCGKKFTTTEKADPIDKVKRLIDRNTANPLTQ